MDKTIGTIRQDCRYLACESNDLRVIREIYAIPCLSGLRKPSELLGRTYLLESNDIDWVGSKIRSSKPAVFEVVLNVGSRHHPKPLIPPVSTPGISKPQGSVNPRVDYTNGMDAHLFLALSGPSYD